MLHRTILLAKLVAVIGVATVTLPATPDDGASKDAPALPTGVAPQYAFAFVRGNTVVLRMRGWTYEPVTSTVPKPGGGQQSVTTYTARPYEYRVHLGLAGIVAHEAGGTPLTPALLRERLKADTPVMVAAEQRLDPFFLRLAKDTAVVLVVPARPLVPPPPGRPNAAATMGRFGYKALPLVHFGDCLCVETTINGAAAYLELDTGSFETHLCANRTPGKSITWQDAGRPFVSAASLEKAPELYGELANFALGDYRATRVRVRGVDAARAKYMQDYKETLAGVLGNDLLREMSAVIDCGAEVLYYRPAGADPAGNTLGNALRELGYRPLELRWLDGMYTIAAKVDGKPALLGLDIGCASLVVAQDGQFKRQLAWVGPEAKSERPQASETTLAAHTGMFATVALAFGDATATNYQAQGLRMGYLYDQVGNQGERMDGLLGKQELRWVWGLLDCKSGVLYHHVFPAPPLPPGNPK